MKAPISAVLVLLASVTLAHAAPVFPPASGVGLEPPPGMKVASGFNGFRDGTASIVVTEMPKAAYDQIDQKRQAFVQRFGATSADDVSINGVRGFLIKGSQKGGSTTFRKWILVLDAPDETALLSAQVPDDDKALTDAAIDAALRSVVFRPRPGLAEQIAALPFTVGDMAGFRPTVSALGAALILTDGPKNVDATQTQAHIVVAADLGHPAAVDADKAEFAKTLLKSFAAVATTKINSAKTFQADGAQWAEVEADGNEGAVNTPIALTLYIRFGADEYFTVICVAPRADAAKYADRFKTVALSVKPKG